MKSNIKMQSNYKVSTEIFSKYSTEIMVSNYGLLNEVVLIPAVCRMKDLEITGKNVIGFWKVKQKHKC